MKPQLVKPDPSSEDSLSVRLNKPEKRKSYTVPLLIAAAVHVVVIGAIVLSLSGKHKTTPKPLEKVDVPALRTEPQSAVAAPAPAPLRNLPAVAEPAPVVKPVAPKPVAKPAPPKPLKTTVSKKTRTASPKVTKAASSKAKAQAAKSKAAKARPAPKKKPVAAKKAPVLDLEKLSKMSH